MFKEFNKTDETVANTKKQKPYTQYWKKLANEKNITCKDVIIHCALKAFFAKNTNNGSKEEIFKSLLTKSFTPVTNKIKLANGCTEWNAIRVAFQDLGWYMNSPVKLIILGMNREESVKNIFDSETKYDEFISFIKNISRNDSTKDLKKRYYTYIFVDQKNVEPIYQAVQAAHVSMVIGQKMSKSFDASNIYFRVCKIPSEFKIHDIYHELDDEGFEVESFYESDVDRVIAIGTHPVPSHKRGTLLKYDELLTF